MRTLMVVLVSLLWVGCTTRSDAEAEPSVEVETTPSWSFADADVQRIYTRMMAAMAPDGAWDRTRYLQFDWIFDRGDGNPFARSHRWDRYEHRYKVEMTNQDGQAVVAVFNTEAPLEGQVWVDGALQEGEAAAELLDRAHGAYINDSYWFIMPYKWADPGVNTRYVGEETDDDGRTWEVVELSFEDVGRTPQNMYRAFVNPETGLMERWWHFRTPDAEPSPADWSSWTGMGGVMVALDRPRPDGTEIRFEDVVVSSEVPDGAFDPPAP